MLPWYLLHYIHVPNGNLYLQSTAEHPFSKVVAVPPGINSLPLFSFSLKIVNLNWSGKVDMLNT